MLPRTPGGSSSRPRAATASTASRGALSERYGVAIDSCLISLCRDGSDAVAWHADTVHKVLPDPLVFTMSLGARRSFLLRPAPGGAVVRRYVPGERHLIVMAGACQHE